MIMIATIWIIALHNCQNYCILPNENKKHTQHLAVVTRVHTHTQTHTDPDERLSTIAPQSVSNTHSPIYSHKHRCAHSPTHTHTHRLKQTDIITHTHTHTRWTERTMSKIIQNNLTMLKLLTPIRLCCLPKTMCLITKCLFTLLW